VAKIDGERAWNFGATGKPGFRAEITGKNALMVLLLLLY
jgi:hypothetical protein